MITTPRGHAAHRAQALIEGSRRPLMSTPRPGSISLAMGEPDAATPSRVVDACVAALHRGETHYTDQQGLPELREAIARMVSGYATDAFSSDEILVTHGATSALSAVMLAHVDPGDVVVIPEPAYSLYEDVVTLAGGEARLVPLADDLHWDVAAIEEALEGASVLVFANPSNPTGMVHTAGELDALMQIARQSGVLVVADEAYDHILFDGREFASALSMSGAEDRVLYVQTFSKTYAMTGWRIGFVAGRPDVLGPVARVHATMNGSCNAFVQRAAIAALDLPTADLARQTSKYEARRNAVVERLQESGTVTVRRPEGAFYAFVGYDDPHNSVWVTEELARRGVLVRPGSEYGPSGEGSIRLSFATSIDNLERSVPIIVGLFEELAGQQSAKEDER